MSLASETGVDRVSQLNTTPSHRGRRSEAVIQRWPLFVSSTRLEVTRNWTPD